MNMSEQDTSPRGTDRAAAEVAVLMPTYQGMEFLERVLDALAAQELDRPWRMIVIDSSSSDGTWEFLEARRGTLPVPLDIERIHGVEFDHGDTRNLLACRAEGAEFLVFLTQDAIPSGPRWLQTLLANFDDPAVGAAYCRNVPRPDARELTKIFSADDPGYAEGRREVRLPEPEVYGAMDAHERRVLYNFNDVASAFRAELWRRHPFPRTPFGEDVLMARAFLEAGYTVVYDDEATVEHSHDYSPEETYARTRIDGEFSAEWLDRICVASASDARVLTERFAVSDAGKIAAAVSDPARAKALEAEAREQRRATFDGLYEGGRTDRRRPTTRMRDTERLRLLYVVHGFPPDTWAGTEIYTYNIAKEMLRRGHEVLILTRAPAEGDEPEFHTRRETFQGLDVIRMTHRLDHASLEESYRKAGPERVFRETLLDFEPDVVHFQHLIHTSVGLVDIAADAGVATVVTCHDYWALCSRVQMIRPDGAICPSNMKSGCYLCVKEKALGQVERVEALDRKGGGGVMKLLSGLVGGGALAPEAVSRRAQEYRELRERETAVPAAYARADLRISPSRFLREKYLESGAFDPHTFLFSDNGMRTDHVAALEKTPDPEGRVRFGFIGSLVWYKGGRVMVEAIKALAEQGLGDRVRLDIHGTFDPEGDAHHRELQELGAGAPVHFHGRFDNARLSEVYREIDVLLVPSVWYENSPITIHEAFLTETPVIASDIGGMAEFVRDGVDGLLFEVGDAGDLARVMARLVREPDLLPRLEAADWMPIKTIEQNGAETEARYRALACVVREPAAAGGQGEVTLMATEARVDGAGEIQAGTGLLLRHGASGQLRLSPRSFGLRSFAGQSLELELELMFLEGEEAMPLGGTLAVDGETVGEVAPAAPGAGVRSRTHGFRVTCAPDRADGDLDVTLTADARSGDDPVVLRFTRLLARTC